MKRFIALLLACAAMTGASVSCGDSEGSEKSSSSSARYDENDDDEVYNPLVGMWECVDGSLDGGGYIFRSNNKLSMYFVMSDMIYCKDGVFYFDGEELEEQYVEFDGSDMKISIEGYNVLSMKRNGPKDSSSYYGEYQLLEDCMLYEAVAESLDEELPGGFEGEMGVEFSDGASYYYIPDMFDYEVIDGSKIKMIDVKGYGTGEKGLEETDDFVISGDKLTITDQKGEDQVFKKLKK